MKLSHELIPAINIDPIISIGLEYLHHILKLDHHGDVIVLAIGKEPLHCRLRITGAHEENISGLR